MNIHTISKAIISQPETLEIMQSAIQVLNSIVKKYGKKSSDPNFLAIVQKLDPLLYNLTNLLITHKLFKSANIQILYHDIKQAYQTTHNQTLIESSLSNEDLQKHFHNTKYLPSTNV